MKLLRLFFKGVCKFTVGIFYGGNFIDKNAEGI